MLLYSKESELPVVCDFGMGVAFERDTEGKVIHQVCKSHFGKLCYNPPELYESEDGSHPFDPVKVDVFQLGVSLFIMTCRGR